MFVYLQNENDATLMLFAVRCEQNTGVKKRLVVCMSHFWCLSSLICWAPPLLASQLNKLVWWIIHQFLFGFLFSSTPKGCYYISSSCRSIFAWSDKLSQLREESCSRFVLQQLLNGVSASSGSLAFVWRKRKQQLLLSEGFSNPGTSGRRKKNFL